MLREKTRQEDDNQSQTTLLEINLKPEIFTLRV